MEGRTDRRKDRWMIDRWMDRKIDKDHYRRIGTILNCVLSKI